MAVAGDKASRFGSGESEIRINKPVVLKAAFPRFMTRGDKAFFGSVVTSQLKEAGTAIVTMKSLDPDIVQIVGDGKQSVAVAAGGSAEVRFDVIAKVDGPRPDSDDREAAERERRVRRNRAGPGDVVTRERGGVRRGCARCQADV